MIDKDIQKLCDRIAEETWKVIEFHLIRSIEIIEGRVPNSAEVSKMGHCAVFRDGRREYTWRGIPVVTVQPNQTEPVPNGPMPIILARQFSTD